MININDDMCKFVFNISIVLLVLCFFTLPYVEKGSGQFVVTILSIVINIAILAAIIIIRHIKNKQK